MASCASPAARVSPTGLGVSRLGRPVNLGFVSRRRPRVCFAISLGDGRDSSRGRAGSTDDALVKHTHAAVALATVAVACVLAATLAQPAYASVEGTQVVVVLEPGENQQRGVSAGRADLDSRRARFDNANEANVVRSRIITRLADMRVTGTAGKFGTTTDTTAFAAPNPTLDDFAKETGENGEREKDHSASSPEGISQEALVAKVESIEKFITAAVRSFIKPLLSEFGAAVLGFGGGAVTTGLVMGWQQSSRNKKTKSASDRNALADLATLDEAEIQNLIGDVPSWLAFRDVERGGWLNKVLQAAWPYLNQATSGVIVAALDPILTATRPSFLTALRFEKFSFGSVPAKIEGVKVYETVNDGAVEIDLSVFWYGDPDVVLGVKAAQDTLSVPVSLTEFQCSFTLRLIFAPLIGTFPCFGALTIALVEPPELDFDLRVVGGDVTLVPGLKESLRTYIKALIASWMVWPRCITVAIPGTGYVLPVVEDESCEKLPITGLLHVQVIGHDSDHDDAEYFGEVGLAVTRGGGLQNDLRQSSRRKNSDAEVRVGTATERGVLKSAAREITLPVSDPTTQLLVVKWYVKGVALDEKASDQSSGKPQDDSFKNVAARTERLTGEASILLDDLMRQAPAGAREGAVGEVYGNTASATSVAAGQWGPLPVSVELEPPVGADIRFVTDGTRGGAREAVLKAAKNVGGFFGKTTSGVVAGYRAARNDGLRAGPIRDAVVTGWRDKAERDRENDRLGRDRDSNDMRAAMDRAKRSGFIDPEVIEKSQETANLRIDQGARVVRLRVRYQPLDGDVLTTRVNAKNGGEGAGVKVVQETRTEFGTKRGNKSLNAFPKTEYDEAFDALQSTLGTNTVRSANTVFTNTAKTDAKLSNLVAAAKSARVAIEHAKRNRSQNGNDDMDLSHALANAEALVVKASLAVEASKLKQDTDLELMKLKEKVAAKRESMDEDEASTMEK